MYILTVSVTEAWHKLHLLTRLAQPWQQTRCPHGRNTTPMSASRQILHVLASFNRLFSISMCHGSLSTPPSDNKVSSDNNSEEHFYHNFPDLLQFVGWISAVQLSATYLPSILCRLMVSSCHRPDTSSGVMTERAQWLIMTKETKG